MLNPSRFEFLSNFSFNLSLESLPSDCLSDCLVAFLSACLPESLLAYPPVCLPACLSTCLPVFGSSLDKTPACSCLMKPTTRETRSTGGRKAERGRYKVGGFRTRRAKAKCLSETLFAPPPVEPARLPASLLMEFSKGELL